MAKSNSTVYDQDYFRWATENAALLRAGALDEADLDHIAEELEDLGKNQKRELTSRIRVVLMHLLKIEFSTDPSERSLRSWRFTLNTQRAELEDHLRYNPSLAPTVAAVVTYEYPRACEFAADEMNVPLNTFPSHSPYTADQVLNRAFVPKR